MICGLLAAALLWGCAAPTKQALLNAPVITPGPTEPPAPTTAPAPPLPEPEPARVPAEAVLFVPDASGTMLVRQRVELPEDSPEALLAALVQAGGVPDVDYGGDLSFEAGETNVLIGGESVPANAVRLDASDAFRNALTALYSVDAERAVLQSLANTFLYYYDAEALALTIYGTVLETLRGVYEDAITFDQYLKTERRHTLHVTQTVLDGATGAKSRKAMDFAVRAGAEGEISGAYSGLSLAFTITDVSDDAVTFETAYELGRRVDGTSQRKPETVFTVSPGARVDLRDFGADVVGMYLFELE